MKEEIDWKKELLESGRFNDKFSRGLLEHGGFEYEILDRQLGRKGHLNGTRGHYDRSTLLSKRIELMNWWSKTLIKQGLSI